jgi:hypothetical protein
MKELGLTAVLFVALIGNPGCKKDNDDGPQQGPDKNEQRRDHDQDRGPDEDRATPWPPAGEKAPPPPGVKEAMAAITTAINSGDHAKVKGLFMSRAQFQGVSDCDPPNVVDRVIEGRDNAIEKLKGGKHAVTFGEFTEGYLLQVKRGDKPAECRAKVDVVLYQTRYKWVWNGKDEQGEAHFLQVGGAWFFVKL